eukprot:80288-Pyramimonas_sp.AAC.1
MAMKDGDGDDPAAAAAAPVGGISAEASLPVRVAAVADVLKPFVGEYLHKPVAMHSGGRGPGLRVVSRVAACRVV